MFQSSPKKLIGQRSEGDVISLVSHVPTFADFAHFPGGADQNGEGDVDTNDGPPRRHGAFQVYRKQTSKPFFLHILSPCRLSHVLFLKKKNSFVCRI